MPAPKPTEALMPLDALIDLSPMTGFQWRILVACAVIAMIDGFDTQAIALVAPEIARSWRVAPAAFGPVFGIGILGGLVGGMTFGLACDKFGRKPCLLLAMFLFGVTSLATPWVTSIAELRVLRLLTGFGLGGALPCIIALTSEFAPRRLRASTVSWMFCGFPLGAMLGGVAAAFILPTIGWRAIFLIGGAIPLALLPLVALTMPESIRLLAQRGDIRGVARTLGRMGLAARWNGEAPPAPPPVRTPLVSLFTQGRATGTLLIWTTLFLSLVMAYFLLNWLPLVARGTGVGLRGAVLAVAALNFGTVAGCLILGPLANRRPALVIGGAYLLGAVSIALIGQAGQSSSLLLAASFAAGFFATGAQFCTIALGAAFYETWLRATGVGWSMGIARIGGVVGPVLGGLLVGAATGAPTLFLIAGLVSLAAALAATALGRVVLRTGALRA